MSLQAGEAEKILISLIDEWLKEGDIKGVTINKTNLDRLNVANVMALKVFDKAKKVDFASPRSDLSYAETCILFNYLEKEQNCNNPLFEELLTIVDDYSITAIDGTTVAFRFSINNIWEE